MKLTKGNLSKISNYLSRIPFWAVLATLAILAYLPFFWQRGFYWDEAPWTWIYFRLGPAALEKTFSTSRPFWGLLYQITLPLVGPTPWAWQILVVIARFLTALIFWKFLTTIWQGHQSLPKYVAILFLVYPGLSQNFISLMYTHFYIVLSFFLLSMYWTAIAIKDRKGWLHLPAFLLSLYHLFAMEYFYFIELARLLVIWILHKQNARPKRQAFGWSAIYLLPLAASTIWRMFFFTNQNASYSYETITAIKANFIDGILGLAKNILLAFWETTFHAWLIPLELNNPTNPGTFTLLGMFIFSIFTAIFLANWFPKAKEEHQQEDQSHLWYMVAVALVVWFVGGGAYWLIGNRTMPQLHFSADRFTLSFMIGSSLLLASLLVLAIPNTHRRNIVFAILVGLAVGKHYHYNSTYRQDWETQRSFFWQLHTRVPELEPGTTIISNDLPFTYFSDNSLSGILNWIYSPPGKMDTILYFASVRTQAGRALQNGMESGNDFSQNYLATTFEGSTDKVLGIVFSPPGCLRVIDPSIEAANKTLPPDLRDAAEISQPDLISVNGSTDMPPYEYPQPTLGWCDIYLQADLARQKGEWDKVAVLWEDGQKAGYTPNDAMEYSPFIEAFAATNHLDDALKLTQKSYRISKEYTRPPLCALWERIGRDNTENPTMSDALTQANTLLECQ